MLFFVFILTAPGPQRVISSFIPKLFTIMAISEFFIFLVFTVVVTIGNSLAEREKTMRDLAIGSDFSVLSIVFGKLTAFLIHLLILFVSLLPFNLLALNLGIDGNLTGFFFILLVIDSSLACWGYFISTLKERIFPTILFWIGIVILLVFTARFSNPLNLVNPLILIYYSRKEGLIYYIFIGVLGLILTLWRVIYLRRSVNVIRS